MSGICGIKYSEKSGPSLEIHLREMVRSLDATGRDPGMVEIMDSLGLGAQPFEGRQMAVFRSPSETAPVALAFHGNLLNWDFGDDSRRTELLTEFAGSFCDDPEEFLRSLQGEFAVAIWDGRDDSLHLATDRFRIHSILYYQDDDKLLFSSRMQSFRALSLPLDLSIEPAAVVDVVGNSMVPTPRTIYRKVHKLPPGFHLKYARGDFELNQYWDADYLTPSGSSRAELVARTRQLLLEAIESLVQRDNGPGSRGAFLSGGIDSSTVVGLLTQLTGRRVKTFTIGFGEEQFNETSYARIAAQKFGSDHHEYFVTPRDVRDVIPLLMEHFDDPFGNASAVPAYFCAKLARENGVRFLYAGDAGDELFAGNERYALQRLFDYYAFLPRSLRDYLVRPIVFFAAERLGVGLFEKGKKYIQRASIPYPERICSYGCFKTVSMEDLFEGDFLEQVGRDYDPDAAIADHYANASASCELDRQLYIDLKWTLADNDILKVKRMTEAAGVTVRFPFMDTRLMDFSTTIPARMKMKGRRLRDFFKKCYSDLLPIEIIRKTKHGFGLPIPLWLRTDRGLNELMHDLLVSPRALQRGYFRRKGVQGLIEKHKTDRTSFYGTILWNLMILEFWHRTHADQGGGN